MDQMLTVLPYLVCPIGMGLMMWMLSRRGKPGVGTGAEFNAPALVHNDEVAGLRAELARVQGRQAAIARQLDILEEQPAPSEPAGRAVKYSAAGQDDGVGTGATRPRVDST